MAHLAFLGTGLLGSGFVHALLDRGHTVHVWNRTAARAQPLVERGALAADTPAQAVRGAVRVHLCLSADDAVDHVLGTCLAALAPGAVIVDHSTTSPARTAARAERLAQAGVAYAHAPVFMSPLAARNAKGVMLCAAPNAVYEPLAKELATMTGDLWYLGTAMHRAAAFKLVGNALLITMAAGLADVFTMGKRQGLAPDEILRFCERFNAPQLLLTVRGPKMAQGDFTASFELDMARKDVSLMVDSAGEAAQLAVLPAILQRMDALIARGHGQDDLGVLAVDAIGARGQ